MPAHPSGTIRGGGWLSSHNTETGGKKVMAILVDLEFPAMALVVMILLGLRYLFKWADEVEEDERRETT